MKLTWTFFSSTSLAGIGLGESISEYIDDFDESGVDDCISKQGQVDIGRLRAAHSNGASKVCGVLVERNSGRIARVSASLDGWDGDETRVKAKYAELCKRYADEGAINVFDTSPTFQEKRENSGNAGVFSLFLESRAKGTQRPFEQ